MTPMIRACSVLFLVQFCVKMCFCLCVCMYVCVCVCVCMSSSSSMRICQIWGTVCLFSDVERSGWCQGVSEHLHSHFLFSVIPSPSCLCTYLRVCMFVCVCVRVCVCVCACDRGGYECVCV